MLDSDSGSISSNGYLSPGYTGKEVAALLNSFHSHSLSEIGDKELMSRFDTKYLVPLHCLPQFLRHIRGEYSVLSIDQQCVFDYETEYFDTSGFSHYRQHHNGASPRLKVRCRTYVNSGKSFLELKRKDNKGRTEKSRVDIADKALLSPTWLSDRLHAISQGDSQHEALLPRVLIKYKRVALMSRKFNERVTIDFMLSAQRADGTAGMALEQMAVVEVKQGRVNRQSPAVSTLTQLRIRSTAFSKYCIACAVLYPDQIKSNRFKKTLLHLQPYLTLH